jgi:hypothetical protein
MMLPEVFGTSDPERVCFMCKSDLAPMQESLVNGNDKIVLTKYI